MVDSRIKLLKGAQRVDCSTLTPEELERRDKIIRDFAKELLSDVEEISCALKAISDSEKEEQK